MATWQAYNLYLKVRLLHCLDFSKEKEVCLLGNTEELSRLMSGLVFEPERNHVTKQLPIVDSCSSK